MQRCIFCFSTLALAVFLLGQNLLGAQMKTSGDYRQKPTSTATSAPSSQGLTIEGILAMIQAGLSEDVIVARIRKEDKAFDLSPEEMIKLKKAGVTDAILRVMLDPKADIKSPTQSLQQPQGAMAPTAPTVVPTAVPVLTPPSNHPGMPTIVTTPVVPVLPPSSGPSGATPAPGSNAVAGDPNDPMTPHDSGIYLYTRDREGNPRMIVLERAAYQGTKTGGVLASNLTLNLKKAKLKAILPGPRASIRTAEQRPVFYFYFEDRAAGLGKSYFGLPNLSTPNQFALIKLEVKKTSRETIIGEYGALGMSSGTHVKSMIPFKSERIRPGLYKVVPTESLEEGEYCFLASAGFGAFGAGAAGALDIFDFAIITQ